MTSVTIQAPVLLGRLAVACISSGIVPVTKAPMNEGQVQVGVSQNQGMLPWEVPTIRIKVYLVYTGVPLINGNYQVLLRP